MDRLDGFVAAAVLAALVGLRVAGSRRPGAAYGMVSDDEMRQPQRAFEPQPASADRSVTLLGATGSIGASTLDLIKRGTTVTASRRSPRTRNAAALAQIAREVGARFAAVADPRGLRRTQGRAVRHRHRGGGGRKRADRGGATASRLGHGRHQRLGRTETHTCRRRARRDRCPCQQGMPRLRRRVFMRPRRRPAPTVLPVDSEHNAIFQALSAGIATMSAGWSSPPQADRSGPGRSDAIAQRDLGAGAQASQLVDGTEDHH